MSGSYKIKKMIVYLGLYILTIGLVASVFLITPYEKNDFPLFRLFIISFATILLVKYFVYMLISPWYDPSLLFRRRSFSRSRAPYHPLVSVIIPAWNEEVGLLNTVKTVLASNYRNLEIVIVNDGSTDRSHEIMREFLREYNSKKNQIENKIKIIYKYKENGGKGKALNHGIVISSGEIVVSIDADCALTPDTIGNFVKHFEDPLVAAAVGNVKIGNSDRILGTLQYLEFLFSFYFKKADSLLNSIYIIGGAAGAFRREVFGKIGLYSPKNITEDIDLSVRIQEKGLRIAYAADAIVYTEGASTIEGLSKQRLRWKQGRFQTFLEHRKLFFSTEERHNKLLSWVVLPFAIFGDIQLFFEVIFLLFLYTYSLLTHDFSSFISGIFVVSTMFFVQMFDDKSKKGSVSRNPMFYLLAPIGWLLFYVTTAVEYGALVKSIIAMMENKKPIWQKWKREGCLDNKVLLGLNQRQ